MASTGTNTFAIDENGRFLPAISSAVLIKCTFLGAVSGVARGLLSSDGLWNHPCALIAAEGFEARLFQDWWRFCRTAWPPSILITSSAAA
jgi:hypothetical protein